MNIVERWPFDRLFWSADTSEKYRRIIYRFAAIVINNIDLVQLECQSRRWVHSIVAEGGETNNAETDILSTRSTSLAGRSVSRPSIYWISRVTVYNTHLPFASIFGRIVRLDAPVFGRVRLLFTMMGWHYSSYFPRSEPWSSQFSSPWYICSSTALPCRCQRKRWRDFLLTK